MTRLNRLFMARMRRCALGVAASAAPLLAAGRAVAQNPLGDGQVLDANLSTISRYNQPRRAFLLNRINDAIVTGTAPGGMSFRGNVGYRSAFEFRGDVAGRPVYDFQRDAYFSNVASQRSAPRAAGVLSLYQVPRSTAAGGSPYAAGNVLTPLSGASLQQVARARYGTGLNELEGDFSLRQIRPQPLGTTPATTRAASPVERDLNLGASGMIPTADPLLDRSWLLGSMQSSQAGRTGGSARRGVQGSTPQAPGTTVPLDSQVRGIDGTFDGVSFMRGWTNRISPESAATARAASPLLAGQDAYADYVARFAARGEAASTPQPGQPYDAQAMSRLRDFAQTWQGVAPAAEASAPPDLPPLSPLKPLATLTDKQIEQISVPLPEIVSLAGDNTSQFAEHVRRAEAALAEERFFDAESWFDVALYYTPDHPLATAGRVHAQIGAGKYRSAALGLRRLFESHPELINSRYSPGLLPPLPRLVTASEELTEMLDRPGETIEAGLLLAYIGHVTQREDLVAAGLDDLERKQPEDALANVLRRVWAAP